NRRHMQGFCELQFNAHDLSPIKNSLIEQQISQIFWRQLFGRGNQHCSCGTILMSPRSKRKVSKKRRRPYVRVPEYLKWDKRWDRLSIRYLCIVLKKVYS